DNMQDRMELVDADGRRWLVTSVRRTGRAGPLLSRWFRSLLTGVPQYRIEHELDSLEPFTLQHIQQRVCEAMQAHPDFWCDDDERETVLPERLAEVKATPTISAIHQVLGLDTFEGY
ncbi:MAG: hypothetical protein JWP50_907, partial [Phenylobacterium sp.]|nr:hypothetical protein [Phenylobacterium sp.]